MRLFFMRHLISFLLTPVFISLASSSAWAWTFVSPDRAEVIIAIQEDGTATIQTTVRFEVRGGQFHGFTLAPLPGASLLSQRCSARTDDGIVHDLSAKQHSDGRIELTLANNARVSRGGMTFDLWHQIDLVEHDNLRLYEGRARLDFTPLVWDWGFESMVLRVELPGPSQDAPIELDPAITADYEVELTRHSICVTKFRSVRWYPMRIIASFDPNLIQRLSMEDPKPPGGLQDESNAALENAATSGSRPSPLGIALVLAVVFGGLLALWRKAHHVHRAYAQVGVQPQFAFLPHTSLSWRVFLSTAAALGGVAAQLFTSVAAGIPAMAAAAMLILTMRRAVGRKPCQGGTWRVLDDAEESRYGFLSRVYRRHRSCAVDITTWSGALLFLVFVAQLGAAAYLLKENDPRLAWIAVVDGLLLGVVAWFSNVRSELPPDVLLEAFPMLDKWRKKARKLLGEDAAQMHLWVREDETGPLEVRLRMPGRAEGLRGIEVAGEPVTTGTVRRIRPALVARFDAGAAKARILAECTFACEHHLTPACDEEIVVLRSRRGKDDALAPLRTALAL
jgi:hypothetical protein